MPKNHHISDAELLAKLRHDTLKHLDLPAREQALDELSWALLLRRIYDPQQGMLAKGRQWLTQVQPHQSALRTIAKDAEALFSRLAALEVNTRKAATQAAAAPTELISALEALRQLLHPDQSLVEEEPGAFDAIDSLLEAPLSHPPAVSSPVVREKARILIVDDRLQAIERFHAVPMMRERFEWITLCELDGPCWLCPHRDGCQMKRARNFRELESALRRAQAKSRPIDVILMDLRFDDITIGEALPIPKGMLSTHPDAARSLQGLIMVRELHERSDLPHVPVVLMTERATLPAGAERLIRGLDGLHFVDDEASIEALIARLDMVSQRARRPLTEGDFYWGRGPAMQKVREQIELLALGPRPILLTGPSGSGKSFLVEEVVLPLSGRSHLVTVDLSAMPESLVESELFGHVKGSFSGAIADRAGLLEEAHGGILFIDEIGHLSPENQRRLLLFLQDRKVRRVGASHRTQRQVDVKVVAATHLELEREVEAGRFRFDLFMRLRPATQIALPRLNQRIEDLDGLMKHLVERLLRGPELMPYVQTLSAERKLEGVHGLLIGHEAASPRALCVRLNSPSAAVLKQYQWPGNTRELESVLDTLLLRALADARMVKSRSNIAEIDHYLAIRLLSGERQSENLRPTLMLAIEPASDLKEMRSRLERAYLIEAFRISEADMTRMTELVLG
ncbi:MAG: sigma 54-interacting transcriptional regulator, partial [Myxococcota bacterium]|nr:sigma 54-interacting transcriptional regulator [Myxococcota bacterium]